MKHANRREVPKRSKKGVDFIQVIIKIVSATTGVPDSAIMANGILRKNRKREFVEARQISMVLAKQFTKSSLATIGANIGGKDHATVLHAIKIVANLIETDKVFASKYNRIVNNLLMYIDSRKIHVCSICGGLDVMTKAWMNANTEKIIKYLDDVEKDELSTYCNTCNAHTSLISKEIFDRYDGSNTMEAISDSLQTVNS